MSERPYALTFPGRQRAGEVLLSHVVNSIAVQS